MFEWTTATLYEEPCDCGSHIRHNNGGNYHRIELLHTFSNDNGRWCVVVECTTTRETFTSDSIESLIFNDGGFELVYEDRLTDAEIDREIGRFLSGEAEIVAQA